MTEDRRTHCSETRTTLGKRDTFAGSDDLQRESEWVPVCCERVLRASEGSERLILAQHFDLQVLDGDGFDDLEEV